MRVNDPDRAPLGIYGWDTAPAPTGFAEFVGDKLPVLFQDWDSSRP